MISKLLISEEISIKSQLQRSFGCITIFAGGVTLAICLGMLYALGADSYRTAQGTINSQSKDNLVTVAQEIANSIDQQLRVVAESICMTSALYSSVLMPYSIYNDGDTLFAPQLSYREYNYIEGCSYPDCPHDFGAFNGQTRLPVMSGFTTGSLTDSSVYLYSTTNHAAARDNASWSALTSTNADINHVIDGLVYQNNDFQTMYSRGPNTTVMFYLASQIYSSSTAGSSYDIIHRTYPGIVKNVSNYDSSLRSWFYNAPVDAFYLYGPYKETFTQQLVITLSSRKQSRLNGKLINTVSAAVMLLTDLNDIVNSVTYTNEGFGALIKYSTHEVLVWGTRTDVFNNVTQKFKTVADFDAILADKIGNTEQTITYTNAAGEAWVVSIEPFFGVKTFGATESSNGLMLLVFGKKSDIEHPLISLQSNIDDTTASVTTATILIVCVTIGVVMLLVCLFVCYITHPLAQMIDMSQEIVHIAAEDEENKDYTSVLHRSFQNMSRSEEVGLLALDYYHIVCLLHNKNIEKKCAPKYPVNPFHCLRESGDSSLLDWSKFMYAMNSKKAATLAPAATVTVNRVLDPSAKDIAIENDAVDDLDVLASLGAEIDSPASNATTSQYAPVTDSEPSIELASIYPKAAGQNPNYVPVGAGQEDIEIGQVELAELKDNADGRVSRGPYSALPLKSSFVKLPSLTKHVSYCASMKSQLYALCFLLLAGVIATMIVTINSLNEEGSSWMNESGDDMLATQVTNLQSIADIKAVYVKNFFGQLSMDLLVGSSYFNELMDGNLTRSNFIASGDYLQSYSADPYNNYYDFKGALTTNYSSYFKPSEANCNFASCTSGHNSNETRLTSLTDIKLRSYYHANNIVSFMQFGIDSDGFTRYLPYTASATYSHPTSCFIGDTSYTSCFNNYYNSACYTGVGSYPAYDPRCRSWYQLAAKSASAVDENRADSAHVHFQYPRMSSSGSFVMTAVIPLIKQSTLYGVLNSNFLADTLSDSINALTILDSGYVYLIDSTNTSIAVLHPDATSSCEFVSCAEDFSHQEYLDFYATVLLPLQNQQYDSVAQTYEKKGKTWQLSYSRVQYDTIDYTLIATVPRSQILSASIKIQNSINTSVTGMIVAFVFAAAIFLSILAYFAFLLVKSIVNPIHDLHAILERVKGDDLTGTIPTHASSLDMKVLMEAFTKFVISLRFGSDSYSRGNPQRALGAFTEALELYTATSNKRGVGASLNNLSVVHLSLQHYSLSEEYCTRAIANATELIEASKNEVEKKALLRTLSDREGNLAVIYLEQNNFAAAFAILERLLTVDKKIGYIKGCVVKQGTLGQYYLKQGEIKSAEKIFLSALEFVTKKGVALQGSVEWNKFEAQQAHQIALFNMALLKQAQGVSEEQLVHAVVECLITTENIHTATTTKCLLLLRTIFESTHETAKVKEVDDLAEENGFNIHQNNTTDGSNVVKQSSGPKRVAFVIDYSGSMSGTKIRTAIENVKSIFEGHIHSGDSIMLVTFSHFVNIVLNVTVKDVNNVDMIRGLIDSVNSPSGSTALYDAINSTLMQLKVSATPGSGSDWIIALTDGEDNGSRMSIDTLIEELSRSKSNLIVMGIGSDVQGDQLQRLTKCMTTQAIYIAANGDKKSIDEAFTQVALLIQGQLILEDI